MVTRRKCVTIAARVSRSPLYSCMQREYTSTPFLSLSLSFLPSPPVLIISHWNYYNLIRYHPSLCPSLAPYCKPTAIIRRVCSLRRRVISRLIYIYIPAYPSLCRALTHSVTHLYNVPTTRLPYSSLAQRCADRASRRYLHLPMQRHAKLVSARNRIIRPD